MAQRPCPARFKLGDATSGSRGGPSTSSPNSTDNLSLKGELYRLAQGERFSHNMTNALSTTVKEMHDTRLKNLKEVADKLKDDSWKYSPFNNEMDRLLSM